MISIDKKIKSFSVKKDDDVTGVLESAPKQLENVVVEIRETTKSNVIQMNEKLSRPELLLGSTYKIKPGDSEHAMYVTINDIILNENTPYEHRRPFEIFINSKNMEQFQWVVGLTRLMSAVFRKGGDITFLVDEMKSVFDPKGGYWKPGSGKFMPSVIAEIGYVIEDHLAKIGLYEKEEKIAKTKVVEQENSWPSSATFCNKCLQKSTVVLDGCATCLNCGASKCG
jgi:hypothetical protein